jgi:VWFA-related protein
MTRAPLFVIVSTALALTSAGRAQTPPQAVFRTTAQSVSVNVSVKRGNNPVNGLGVADFRLWDNNVPQKIDSISVEAIPIDVTLIIDMSGSTAGGNEGVKADLRKIAAMLRPDDQLRLLTIDTYVHQVFRMQPVATAPPIDELPTGTSAVYDALLMAMLHRVDPDRRHLVVAFTDGLDTRSAVSASTVRDVARHAECVLHIVLINGAFSLPPGFRNPPLMLGDDGGLTKLEEAADRTGGQLHGAPIFRDPVVNAFRDAFDEFRKSYLLRFTPAGVAREGWHDLRVEAGKNSYAVKARKGYFGD